MNKLYHTEKIYLLVPLFHVSFRERLAPGDAFLSPNTKFASKGFQSCPGKIVFLAVQKCSDRADSPARGDFCRLQITKANSFGPGQDQQDVGLGLDPNSLTLV